MSHWLVRRTDGAPCSVKWPDPINALDASLFLPDHSNHIPELPMIVLQPHSALGLG